MRELIGFELCKLLKKKIVYAGLTLFAVFGVMMYNGWGPSTVMVRLPEGRYIQGREAIQYNQELMKQYEGELTDEKVQEILNTYAPGRWDGSFWTINFAFDSVKAAAATDGTWDGTRVQSFLPAYQDEKPLQFAYSEGYINFLFMGSNLMVVLALLLIVVLSPLFSEEYMRGTDALILTARYGKNRCIRAKIQAAFLFTFLLTAATLLSELLGFYLAFGLEGGGGSIQVNNAEFLNKVPYFLTCLDAMGYSLLLWVAGSLFLTAIVLLFSALFKTSFVTLIAALAAYALPMTLSGFGLPDELMALTPMGVFLLAPVLEIPKLGGAVSYVWVSVGFAMLLTLLLVPLSKRLFARHQVT